MGAPKGNQFWKLRSKHGRNRIFESPELMWEAACEYFQWCIDNPLEEEQLIKTKVDKDFEKVQAYKCSKMRPFTVQGLTSYLDCNVMYFNNFETSIEEKTDSLSIDFSIVITRIKETIYRQKFEGAAAGFLNATIVSRDLGLQDRKDITSGGEKLSTTVVVQDQAAKANLDKLIEKEKK